jgi:hypothetical protein
MEIDDSHESILSKLLIDDSLLFPLLLPLTSTDYTGSLFDFIEEAVAGGNNVMVTHCDLHFPPQPLPPLPSPFQVHCLAGAHRAGTTGCACLIHFAGMDVRTAIASAKKCRPIIDPIGALPQFLDRLYAAKQSQTSTV